jgi:signal transduction histidine kinase/CheY-like chemotaxis protein
MKKIARVTAYQLLLGLLSFYCSAQQTAPALPLAQKGILDLRNADLSKTPVSLNGEWRFYWKQLLQPGTAVPVSSDFIQYPSLWKGQQVNGQTLSSQGYATYTLTILLPKEKPRLALKIPDVYSSYKLYANGNVFYQNGQPAATADKAAPFWTTEVVVLPPNLDTLRLILQVANFWHSKGGTYKEIIIGDKQQLLLKHHRDTAIDLLLAGCLFMGGLFFLGLFVFARKDKIILYFSLFCIISSYRMIGTDLYVLHSLFPDLNWLFSIRVEYLALVIGVALFSQYTRMLYPKDNISVVMQAVIWFCLIYAGIILVTPPVIFSSLLIIFLCVMFLYIAYAFYVYIQAVRHKRSGSIYALLSSGVMLLVYFFVNLQYFNLIPEHKVIVFAGYIAFFFLQSLVLSHRFSETLRLAAMQAQQGLKAKSEFLSTMSHEIRTPLNSVVGMAHLLQRSKPRQDQKEHLDVLMFSAANLLSIVNNILDYNKIEAGKIIIEKINTDLPAICRNIVSGLRNLANEKMIGLQLDIDERLTQKVIGDPTRTSQVINNLLHNAIKFTKEGMVRLSVKADKFENGFVTVTISVHDTGIGIPIEKQQLIFERFTQADSSTSRSFGGTGLGLSISKKILEMQGSDLKVKSKPGEGSEFYFTQTFAISEEKAETTADTVKDIPEETKLLQDVGILLVEDNPLNVLVAQTFLERCGASIDVAVNGEEALEKFDALRHRVVLMDLDMPVMDGYEATRRLRLQGETLPVIALTASLPKEVESDVYAAGLTDIIVKPFDPDDLFRVILYHLPEVAA